MPAVIRPTFTVDQRNRLLALKLIGPQLDQLEAVALPVAKALLADPAPLQELREEMSALHGALDRAIKGISKIFSPRSVNQAGLEVRNRVLFAEFSSDGNGQKFASTLRSLTEAIEIVESAKQAMPTSQRRKQSASILPIQLINSALVDGFWKGYPAGQQLPRYPLRMSSSPGSAYREIIGICYEAMSQPNTDPERAIKEFIRRDRLRRKQVGRQDMKKP